jgi:RND family efflux transporter MFP subunit
MRTRLGERLRGTLAACKALPARKLCLRLSLPAAVIALAVALLAMRPSQMKARVGGEALGIPPVPVAKVQREDLYKELTVQAEFRPYREIDLHAKVAGYLQQINVDIGDPVKEGDLVATLEIPELTDDIHHALAAEKRSEDEVQRAEAAYADAHLAYSRLAEVDQTQPGLVAQQDVDTARSKDRAAESALAAAKEQVQIAKADVEKLQTMLKYSRIIAPFSGVITKRYADPGALIQAGTSSAQALPLVRLSENDRLRLVFPLSVSAVPFVKIGDAVGIHVDSLERTFQGKISRSTRKVDTATRTMDVEVDVPNADLSLIPGIYASVSFQIDRREKVLAVPVQAVSHQTPPTVYLVDKDNRIEERPVKLGLETPAKFEVTVGIGENDLVLVGSRAEVKPGQRVEPKVVELVNAP